MCINRGENGYIYSYSEWWIDGENKLMGINDVE